MLRTYFTHRSASFLLVAGTAGLLCLTALAAAAGAYASESSAGEAALRERVEQLYTALQSNDWTKVETFLTDDSKEIFQRQPKSGVKGFEIQSVTLDPGGQTASVTVEIPVFGPGAPGPLPVEKRTRWRLVNGNWYLELPKSDPNLLRAMYTPAPKQAFSRAPVATSKDLKFQSTWYGFGELHQDQPKVASFAFKNVSDHVVRLVEVQSGCDCLKLKSQQKEFKPGESSTIKFAFDPSTMPVAVREASTNTVLLKTEPGDAYVSLTISAILLPGNASPAKPSK